MCVLNYLVVVLHEWQSVAVEYVLSRISVDNPTPEDAQTSNMTRVKHVQTKLKKLKKGLKREVIQASKNRNLYLKIWLHPGKWWNFLTPNSVIETVTATTDEILLRKQETSFQNFEYTSTFNIYLLSCRFLLCFCTYITIAQRQRAALNMTLREARTAKDYVRGFDRFKTIAAWQHKTAASFGSAKIILPYPVHDLLQKYIQTYRLSAADEDFVFVSPSTGERVQRVARVLELA